MSGNKSRRLRQQANLQTVGMPKEETRRYYRHLKAVYKKVKHK